MLPHRGQSKPEGRKLQEATSDRGQVRPGAGEAKGYLRGQAKPGQETAGGYLRKKTTEARGQESPRGYPTEDTRGQGAGETRGNLRQRTTEARGQETP